MVQQMTDLDRKLTKLAIQKAKTRPQDIADCLKLVTDAGIFSLEKVEAYEDELWDVCRQIILVMGAVRPTPPRSASSPPSLADRVPRIPHSDAALVAAVGDNQDRTPDAVILGTYGDYHYANARYTNAEFSYILQKTVKNVGLRCNYGLVQIEWEERVSDTKTDHTALASTVFIPVSEEEAARAGMSADILFGKHYMEDPNAQLAAMGIQSAPSSRQVQPHPSCACSDAEAPCYTCAMRPTSSGSRDAPHSTGVTDWAACSPVSGPTRLATMGGSRHGLRLPHKSVSFIPQSEPQKPELCSDRRSQNNQGHREGLQKERLAFAIDGHWAGNLIRSGYCFALGALVIWLWYAWGQRLH